MTQFELAAGGLEWLLRAAESERVHTVRLGWTDRLGTWRGKRVPVESFLAGPERRVGFCDGMIVADVRCDIHQETPFSNFDTGYPDMYLRPEPETARPVGWQSGEAYVMGRLEDHDGGLLPVAPRNVLDRVAERGRALGVEARVSAVLGGRLMHGPRGPARLLPDGVASCEGSPDVLRLAAEGLGESGVGISRVEVGGLGSFRMALEPGSAVQAADALALTKAALRETALAHGLHAIFMTRLPGTSEASTIELRLDLSGGGVPKAIDLERLARALEELRALLQPSVTASKLGPVRPPSVEPADGGVAIRPIVASAEADAATAIAVALACALASDSIEAGRPDPEPGLGPAARALGESALARDWLGTDLVDNSVALLKAEQRLFDGAVTDWELERYWVQA